LRALPIDKINRQFNQWAARVVYDYYRHVEIATELDRAGSLPATFETLRIPERTPYVWSDVIRMRTLNMSQSQKKREMHVCPLQFDIVDRCIENWSNPGEEVVDPFGGIMTVPYRAMKLGRRGKGVELNPDYYRDGLSYLRAMEADLTMPTLFSL
jgi:DNA modification methylase